jgi:hypothetical protein
MKIVIPTYGRWKRQRTFYNLPPHIQKETQLVVQQSEAINYQGFDPIVLPGGIYDIATTRDWIIDHWPDEHILMLDDDLDFAMRRMDDPTKFEPVHDLSLAIEEIDLNLHRYAHVSMSPREGGNRNTDRFKINGRAMRVLGYDAPVIRRLGLKFAPYTFMCDFGMTLELLTRGYPNLILNYYVNNQAGSQAMGGCSTQRTPELQAAAAEYLESKFPNYVTLTSKPGWGKEATRVDVKIQWQRAYKAGRKSVLLDERKGESSTAEGGGGTETLE